MLITFTSRASADITIFGDVAVKLLKIMGHSGTVPGAFQAADLPAALSRLQQAVTEAEPAPENPDAEFQPSLAQRALPLIKLLEAAIQADTEVLWDKS